MHMHVSREEPGFGLAHFWTATLLINDPVRVSPANVIFREYDRGSVSIVFC